MQAIDLFLKGGTVMYALLVASIFAVTITVERYLFFKSLDSGSEFAQKATELFENGDYDKVYELCKATSGSNAKIISSGMQSIHLGANYVERHLETQASIFVADLRRRIPYLGIIVTMSPLLGLLGTVIGMISSFNVFSAQAGQPHAITGGVGEALIATASGLIVAIIALIAHSYFAQRIDTMLTDMEKTFSAFVEYLHRGA